MIKVIDNPTEESLSVPHKSINAQSLWSKTKGEGVRIAVIDTGLNRHIDFSESIAKTINVFDRTTTEIPDIAGHGTFITGIISSERYGISPMSKIYSTNVLNDKGLGTYTAILDGITFAINNKVDILCMSLGAIYPLPQMIDDRLRIAHSNGITIVCATGNSSNNKLAYPSNEDYIVSVGGSNENGKRASFSNYGRELDFVAPSIDIVSTFGINQYGKMSGTSVSAPIIVGACALVISYYRMNGIELSPSEVKNILIKASNDKKTRHIGWGTPDLSKIGEL